MKEEEDNKMPSSSSSSAGAATSVIPDEIRTRVEELLGVTNVEPPSQLTWYNSFRCLCHNGITFLLSR